MRPPATFVNYVWTIKISKLFRRLGVPLLSFFNERRANQPTITGLAQCHKKVGDNGIDEHGAVVEG
jgi:hypothetical protein